MERLVGKIVFFFAVLFMIALIGLLAYYSYLNQTSKNKTIENIFNPHHAQVITYPGKILFISYSHHHQTLARINPNTEKITTLMRIKNLGFYLTISSSGKKAIYEIANHDRSQLYLLNLLTWKSKQLTTSGNNLMPSFSPSGKRIIYIREKQGAFRLLEVLTLKTKKIKPFVKPKHWYSNPKFLPDGSVLCTAYLNGRDQIIILDPKTNQELPITHNRFKNSSPSISPNGKKIVFISNRAGNPEIYTIHTNGNHVHRLTFTTNVSYQDPTWSPDNKDIVFSANLKGNHFHLYIINRRGKILKQLTAGHSDELAPQWYLPSAQG